MVVYDFQTKGQYKFYKLTEIKFILGALPF